MKYVARLDDDPKLAAALEWHIDLAAALAAMAGMEALALASARAMAAKSLAELEARVREEMDGDYHRFG